MVKKIKKIQYLFEDLFEADIISAKGLKEAYHFVCKTTDNCFKLLVELLSVLIMMLMQVSLSNVELTSSVVLHLFAGMFFVMFLFFVKHYEKNILFDTFKMALSMYLMPNVWHLYCTWVMSSFVPNAGLDGIKQGVPVIFYILIAFNYTLAILKLKGIQIIKKPSFSNKIRLAKNKK